MFSYILYYIISFILLVLTFLSPAPTPTPTSTPVPIVVSTPIPTVISTPIPVPVVIPTNTWSAEERELIRLLNEYRGDTLIFDENLTSMARWMSNDMYVNNRFSHIDSLGRDFRERSYAFGCDENTFVAENLAKNSPTTQIVFEMWKKSSIHNTVMLRSDLTHVGVSKIGGYWTLELESK